jgi:hypothetical protein
MCPARKGRTATTNFEQAVLAAHIHRFFAAPERSAERARTVRAVLPLLNFEHRRWTSRLVRVWFNNNRRRLGDVRGAPWQLPYPQPVPQFDFGYLPVLPVMMSPQPAQQRALQNADQTPQVNPEFRRPPDVEYFPLPPFRPPGS